MPAPACTLCYHLTPKTVPWSNFADDTTAANSRAIAASIPPAGYRINVIRDIHGRADLLIETIARIDEMFGAIRAAERHF
jgi:hypothetical protein